MTAKRRSRRAEVARIILALTALMAPFGLYVKGHFEIVQTAYDMESIDEHLAELERENRALRLDRARLLALDRVEAEARRLGLEPLPIQRLLVVANRVDPAPVPQAVP